MEKYKHIAVDAVATVAVLQSQRSLAEEPAGLALAETAVGHDEVHDLAASSVFHRDEEVRVGLDDLVQLDDVRVVQHLHDGHLALHHPQRVWRQRRLVDHLRFFPGQF